MEKRRSALVAVLLNVPLPGLGQLYCGRPGAALMFLGLSFGHWLAFILAWVVARTELSTALSLWCGTFGCVWLGALVHAGLSARRIKDENKLASYNLWYFYLLVLLLAWAGHYGIFRLVGARWLSSYPLQSDGMTPGLLVGDWIRVDLRGASRGHIERGTVVAALDPYDGQSLRVLRVVGLPGESVQSDPDGLSIDECPIARRAEKPGAYQRRNASGEWVEQRYALFTETVGVHQVAVAEDPDPSKRRSGRWQIPEGHLLLIGDNRIHAVDSSVFGPVPAESVQGVVFQVWFSRDPLSRKFRPERKGLDIE